MLDVLRIKSVKDSCSWTEKYKIKNSEINEQNKRIKLCLEDVVAVDDAVENVEDGVDADGKCRRTVAGQ